MVPKGTHDKETESTLLWTSRKMAPNGERKKKTSFVYCWEKKVLMKLSAPSSSSKKEELTNRAESIE